MAVWATGMSDPVRLTVASLLTAVTGTVRYCRYLRFICILYYFPLKQGARLSQQSLSYGPSLVAALTARACPLGLGL